jgi:hypothetical protein
MSICIYVGTRFRARLHFCACQPASIWLDTMPTSFPLTLSDSDFASSARLRLGLPAGLADFAPRLCHDKLAPYRCSGGCPAACVSAGVLRPALHADVGRVLRAPWGPGPDAARGLGRPGSAGWRVLAPLRLPSSRGRSGSLALPFAWATRPCVGRARTSRRIPLAGPRCAVSPGPQLTLFRPVSRPVCGFGVFGSALLCVA